MDSNKIDKELMSLSEEERLKIFAVIQRNDSLRKKQQMKIRKLKDEIDSIEAKSLNIPTKFIHTATTCIRCLQPFGYFFNTGDFCKQCKYKVCQKCRINYTDYPFLTTKMNKEKTGWLCILCHKYNEWIIQTHIIGNWIDLKENSNAQNSLSPSNSQDVLRLSSLSGSEKIKLAFFPDNMSKLLEEEKKENSLNPLSRKTKMSLKKAKSAFSPINKNLDFIDKIENDNSKVEQKNLTNSTTRDLSQNSSNTHIEKDDSLPTPTLPTTPTSLPPPEKDTTLSSPTEFIMSRVKTFSSRFLFGSSETPNETEPLTPTTKTSLNKISSNSILQKNSIQTSKSTKNLQFKENVTCLTSTKSTPNISNERLGNRYDDDLCSVTSSELENPSVNLSFSNRTKSSNEIQTNNNPNSINASKDNQKLMHKNLIRSSSSKSNTSQFSKKDNNSEDNSDNEMIQMDKLFEKGRESIKQSKKDTLSNFRAKANAKMPNESIVDTVNPIEPNLKSKGKNFSSVKNVSRVLSSPTHSLAAINSLDKSLNSDEREYLRREKAKFESTNILYDTGNGNAITNGTVKTIDNKNNNVKEENNVATTKEHTSRGSPFFMSLKKRAKSKISLNSFHRASSTKSINKEKNSFEDENVKNKPEIEIKLSYERKSSNLSVSIYVKIYLEPGIKDKNNKRKTTKKHGYNPEFDDVFRYTLAFSDLAKHKLWVSVWHKETFDRNKLLGEVYIPLSSEFVNDKEKWHVLDQKQTQVPNDQENISNVL